VRSTVSVGERVSRGQILGTVGSGHSHCTPQVCLHLGIRRAGRYLNPLDVLEGFGPVRLLRLDR
jgi:murein DD-endopeptidase MepM/ murein hydrolase activator NlpD